MFFSPSAAITAPLAALTFIAAAVGIPPEARADQTISVLHFRSVGLEGGGTVTIVPSNVQRVVLRNGSTAYTRISVRRGGSLEIKNCYVRCPRDYRMDLVIETPNVEAVAVSNGGLMRFASSFAPQREISVAVASGGAIDLRALRVSDVSAAVNSGGSIELGTPAQLSAAVNSGGSIRYRGHPEVSMAVANGGSVERAN